MNDKEFIKPKKNISNIVVIFFVALLATFLGAAFMYVIVKDGYVSTSDTSTNDTTSSTNTTYKIEGVENPVVAIAEETSPSIVGVKVTYITQSMGLLEDSGSEGSGIIYSQDGYIITNYHVISEAIGNSSATVTVTLYNSEDEISATIVGGDEVSDLAVLKIDKTGLTSAKIGKSSDVKVGEIAVAIGNPLGQQFASTVTGGYISAVNRKVTFEGISYTLIQTDAAINPGNSGGALVNSSGEVVGINTAKISETDVEGIGFAIPVDDAIPIVDELIKNKKISRPYIGITGFSVDKTTADRYNLVEGIYVSEVSQNTGASKAGLKKGDIITKADDTDVTTMEELNEIKNSKKVGDTITLKVYRNSNYVDIKVTLEENNTDDQ